MLRFISLLLALVIFPSIISGQDYIVVQNDLAFGEGSFLSAVLNINSGGTITFDPTLSSVPFIDPPTINKDITIDGGEEGIHIREDLDGPSNVIFRVSGASLTLRNVSFLESTFDVYREGILRLTDNSELILVDVHILCYVQCLYQEGGNASIDNSTLFAVCCGLVAQFVDTQNVSMTDVIIGGGVGAGTDDIPLGGDPGGVDINSGNLSIVDSRFSLSLLNNGATVDISNSEIIESTHYESGYGFGNLQGNYTIDRSRIGGGAGGIAHVSGSGTVTNSILQANSFIDWLPTTIPLVNCQGGQLKMYNSSILGFPESQVNSRTIGGISTSGDCNLELHSSLVIGDPAIEESSSIPLIIDGRYNLISDPNIIPYFDPILEYDRGQPAANSPLIDQGDCSLLGPNERDFRDELRPWDSPLPNSTAGDGCDIGAYERQDLNPSGLTVSVKFILSGAWRETTMSTELNTQGLLPLTHPYDGIPTSLASQEFLDDHPDIVDWVWLGLRKSIDEPVLRAKQVAFVQKEGQVASPAGEEFVRFHYEPGEYFLTVGNRNHLGVTSAGSLGLNHESSAFDFSNSLSSVYASSGVATQELGPGIFGLWGGDGNGDGEVSAFDILNVWLPNNGGPVGYLPEDFNLNGSATALDFLQVWLPASGQAIQAP